MGICDARRQTAAESQILLVMAVMAVDHIDPPVRKQVRRIVVPGMKMTVTYRRQVFGISYLKARRTDPTASALSARLSPAR